ncbi:MAG: ribonuclease Z [Bacteroidota bacterium]
MKFELTVLGCSSATPTRDRHPSSQVLTICDKLFLVDCGEGTQMQMRKYHVKFQRIDHIFISHLHGDHYLGLAGLLFTMHLFGRTKELHIFANSDLDTLLKLQFKASETHLLYPLVFHPLAENTSELLYEDEKIRVSSFPLVHRVPTHGFLFVQKNDMLHLNRDNFVAYHIPFEYFKKIQQGEDYIDSTGKTIPNKELTLPRCEPKRFAYCSDTAYSPEIIPYIENADLLYHETTFMNDMEATATLKQHSTTIQAAQIAKQAHVKKLLIGHFSARYDDLAPVLDETMRVFANSELAIEGESYCI